MNAESREDFRRLVDAVNASRRRLRVWREKRVESVAQYAGYHYGDGLSRAPNPMNFLELAVTIYTQALVGGRPRAFVSSRRRELRPLAYTLKLALDRTSDEIDLGGTIWRAVQDAMFVLGVVKIGMADVPEPGRGAWWSEVWRPYVDQVDFDDWVHDTTARRLDQVRFEGNYYRVPLREVRENESFDPEAVKEIKKVRKYENRAEDRAEEIGYDGEFSEDDEIEDYTELLDLWLPDERLVVTCAAENPRRPLRVVEWSGPQWGPYLKLYFTPVPGNAMPLTVSHMVRDMHDVIARLSRKLCAQAMRQKSVLPISEMIGEDDAARVVEVEDGKAFRFGGSQIPSEVRFGGPDNLSVGFLLQLRDWANRHAGNLETLGGLAAQAGTLGQEQILTEQASQRLRFMRTRCAEFVERIFRSLAHYLFTDPFVNVPVEKSVDGGLASVETAWSAETRAGRFEDYEIGIEPYSMTYRSPEAQLQKLLTVFNSLIAPLMPMMESQGAVIDYQALLRLVEQYGGLEELSSIVRWQSGEEQGDRSVGRQEATRPQVSVRRYERQSIPSARSKDNDAALRLMLQGSEGGGRVNGRVNGRVERAMT